MEGVGSFGSCYLKVYMIVIGTVCAVRIGVRPLYKGARKPALSYVNSSLDARPSYRKPARLIEHISTLYMFMRHATELWLSWLFGFPTYFLERNDSTLPKRRRRLALGKEEDDHALRFRQQSPPQSSDSDRHFRTPSEQVTWPVPSAHPPQAHGNCNAHPAPSLSLWHNP